MGRSPATPSARSRQAARPSSVSSSAELGSSPPSFPFGPALRSRRRRRRHLLSHPYSLRSRLAPPPASFAPALTTTGQHRHPLRRQAQATCLQVPHHHHHHLHPAQEHRMTLQRTPQGKRTFETRRASKVEHLPTPTEPRGWYQGAGMTSLQL